MEQCGIRTGAEDTDLPPHQKHQSQYKCEDVVAMEGFYGPHAEGCPWVGHIAPQACKCK